MSESIICGQCPDVYKLDAIEVLLGEERVMSLAELQGTSRVRHAPHKRSFFRTVAGMPAAGRSNGLPDLGEGVMRLRAYKFRCPRGHDVSGNPGAQLGLAILGVSGSSKTHMLPALIRELDDMSRLRPVGVTLSDALYPNPKLTQDVLKVYRRGERLEATPPGAMRGPYGYKLLVARDPYDPEPQLHSLQLFDIAGEDLEHVARIAENAKFILVCRAIIVLIDPSEILPTQFDSAMISNERARIDAASDIRRAIRVIADTLAEVRGLASSRSLQIPICFVVAKADAVDWTGGFDWSGQTDRVLACASDGDGDLTGALCASSGETRDALVRMGGGLVVDEIESRFADQWIRYAPASATSAMPRPVAVDGEIAWVEHPQPNGAALSLLQVLDMAGVLPNRAREGA